MKWTAIRKSLIYRLSQSTSVLMFSLEFLILDLYVEIMRMKMSGFQTLVKLVLIWGNRGEFPTVFRDDIETHLCTLCNSPMLLFFQWP